MGKKSETAKGDSKKKAAKTTLKIRKSVKSAVATKPKEAKTTALEAKAAPKTKTKKSAKPPTFEEIQLQAYFIAEKRKKLGLPGNSDTDWIQAEKELLTGKSV